MDQKTLSERLLSSPASDQWKKIGIRNHNGIALPLFSLHSAESCGIGEFLDLIPLIDWCKEIGMDVVQLLPLNDSGHETSPYSALSAFAFNPIHLSIARLPSVLDDPTMKKQVEHLQTLTRASQRIDYRKLHQLREGLLQRYYTLHAEKTQKSEAYKTFVDLNSSWLTPYSIYKTIKRSFNWRAWWEWPLSFQTPCGTDAKTDEESAYHRYIQYLCFAQFEEVKRHAEKRSVLIKGDVPILINRDSADVWEHRNLFRLDLSAGAPPDMYNKEGQKWGFPLYDWHIMAADDYQWWVERLAVAAGCYHLYRIDHIVGFYRIWGIPLDLPAKDGHFVPQDIHLWIPQGETIMRMMLLNCPMLPIGEDLGTVPDEVRENLLKLGICGTKVMRWERYWHGDQTFIPSKDYPPESMTTVSTHDSETLGQWWSDRPEEATLYCQSQGWDYRPVLSSDQRLAILRSSHHSGSLFHINLLQEYLALIPGMTWPDPADERINVPGVISDKNWTYRFKPSIEEIASSKILKQMMLEIIQ